MNPLETVTLLTYVYYDENIQYNVGDTIHDNYMVQICTVQTSGPFNTYCWKPLESHPFETLTVLKNLTNVESKDESNPIRVKGGTSEYFSGTIVMLTSTGSLFAVPLHSKFENVDFNRIHKERKVHFVLLPKNLPLFESSFTTKLYNIG
jgi:hypothetical protein